MGALGSDNVTKKEWDEAGERLAAMRQEAADRRSLEERFLGLKADKRDLELKVKALEDQVKNWKQQHAYVSEHRDELEGKVRILTEQADDWKGQLAEALQEKKRLEDRVKDLEEQRKLDQEEMAGYIEQKNLRLKSSRMAWKQTALGQPTWGRAGRGHHRGPT